MSVSFVVPVWRRAIYEALALPWLTHQVEKHGAELIEVSGDSIFEAHEKGRLAAKHDLICYVHDDVRLVEPMDLVPQIVQAFYRRPKLGLIGPVGRGGPIVHVPWWKGPGPYVGHYLRPEPERWVYGYGQRGRPKARTWSGYRLWREWKPATLVDGFCLVEHRRRMTTPWDTTTYPGHWHGYDADRCQQARALGLQVMVSPWLFLHGSVGHAGYKGTDPVPASKVDAQGRLAKSAGDELWLSHLDVVNDLFRKKWGLHPHKAVRR